MPLNTPTQAARPRLVARGAWSLDAHGVAAELVLGGGDGLGQRVGGHGVGGHVGEGDLAAGDALAGKVVQHVDVLGSQRDDGFLSRLMAAWLSAAMSMQMMGRLRSAKSLRSHRASLVAAAAAMYSASVVETATVGCRREVQVMAPPLRMNT